MKAKFKSHAVLDIRGIYRNDTGYKLYISHIHGDTWVAHDEYGQEYRGSYEDMVEVLEDHNYRKVSGFR